MRAFLARRWRGHSVAEWIRDALQMALVVGLGVLAAAILRANE